MRNSNQKPVRSYVYFPGLERCGPIKLQCCAIIALLIGLIVCDPATARPQFGSGDKNQVPVGTFDAAGKTWSSVSHAMLETEAILRRPPTTAFLTASDIMEAIDALQAMGLDVILTSSATDDSLTGDEDWEVIGNSNETGEILGRYLRSRNAVFSVTKKGTIEIISLDEMNDERHFQTIIYRVDHLGSKLLEIVGLASQIQDSLQPENWEANSGSATIQARIQSGHSILIVSNHYQHQVSLRQFLYELSVASSGPRSVASRSKLVGVSAAQRSGSRVVNMPSASGLSGRKLVGSRVLELPKPMQ